MFKSVTIEPRPNNERHRWVVRCRIDDTVDHEKPCVSLEDAFVEAQAWLLHGDMLKRADRLDTYTLITEGTDEDDRPCFNVWLQVDQQQFCTTPQPYDTREEAEWFREQLASALLRIVREQEEKG